MFLFLLFLGFFFLVFVGSIAAESLRLSLFKALLVDEVSQIGATTLLVAVQMPPNLEKLVAFGDICQLPPVIFDDNVRRTPFSGSVLHWWAENPASAQPPLVLLRHIIRCPSPVATAAPPLRVIDGLNRTAVKYLPREIPTEIWAGSSLKPRFSPSNDLPLVKQKKLIKTTLCLTIQSRCGT